MSQSSSPADQLAHARLDQARRVLGDAGLSRDEVEHLLGRVAAQSVNPFPITAALVSPLATLVRAGMPADELTALPGDVLSMVLRLPRYFPDRSEDDLARSVLALRSSQRGLAVWRRIIEAMPDADSVTRFVQALPGVSTDDALRLLERGLSVDDLSWLAAHTSAVGPLAYLNLDKVAALDDPARRRLALLLLCRLDSPPVELAVALAASLESGVDEVTRLVVDGWPVDEAAAAGLALTRRTRRPQADRGWSR